MPRAEEEQNELWQNWGNALVERDPDLAESLVRFMLNTTGGPRLFDDCASPLDFEAIKNRGGGDDQHAGRARPLHGLISDECGASPVDLAACLQRERDQQAGQQG